MDMIEFFASATARNLDMLKMALADFSDADLWVRPCPGANTAGWQLGHMIAGEVKLATAAGAKMPELPSGFAERFNKQTAGIDKPTPAPTKAEFLDLADKVRAATVAWIRTLKMEDLERPGPEMVRQFAPTVAHFILLVSGHTTMHLGQVQVIRRKLGRPVMF